MNKEKEKKYFPFILTSLINKWRIREDNSHTISPHLFKEGVKSAMCPKDKKISTSKPFL